MSVDVEHVFRHGRLVLSHVHSRMSVQMTRALLCLNSWIKYGYMKNHDILIASLFVTTTCTLGLGLHW